MLSGLRKRMVIFGSLCLTSSLAACGTQSATPTADQTGGLTISVKGVSPVQSQEFMVQTSIDNQGSRPVYIRQNSFNFCVTSVDGGLNGQSECYAPASSAWEGRTIGKFFALPVTLKPGKSIQVNLMWQDLYMAPSSATVSLGVTSSVHTSANIPASELVPYSENLIHTLLVNLTHAVDKFHNSPYNPKHFWPTYDAYSANQTLQPVAGSARQLDISAVDNNLVTLTGYYSGEFGQKASNPAEQYNAQTPDVLSSQYPGAPWGQEDYYGVTANGTVFLTFTPPNVPATDSNNISDGNGANTNGTSTGNGAWTNGNVRAFTAAHSNNGILLSSIWGDTSSVGPSVSSSVPPANPPKKFPSGYPSSEDVGGNEITASNMPNIVGFDAFATFTPNRVSIWSAADRSRPIVSERVANMPSGTTPRSGQVDTSGGMWFYWNYSDSRQYKGTLCWPVWTTQSGATYVGPEFYCP